VGSLPACGRHSFEQEVTRLTGKKPKDATRVKMVTQKPSSVVPGRPIGLDEPLIPSSALVRYLYQPGELEGGRRTATDPVWSLTTHTVRNVVRLNGGPSRGFVREELLIVPPGTELPPDGVLTQRTR